MLASIHETTTSEVMTMRVINRELHLVLKDGTRETYEEFYTESNVERLWFDRLSTNSSVEMATLVYRDSKTGKIEDSVKLK